MAGAGIAVGPILGGWVTTYLTWRVVFAGEVVVALAILAGVQWVTEPAREATPPELDHLGSAWSSPR